MSSASIQNGNNIFWCPDPLNEWHNVLICHAVVHIHGVLLELGKPGSFAYLGLSKFITYLLVILGVIVKYNRCIG